MTRLFCNGKKDFRDEPTCNKECSFYNGSGGEYRQVQTNGDYIRAMTDAELSVFINGNCTCDCCANYAQGCIEAFNMSKCIEGVKAWLGQERKVDDGKK